MSAEQREGKRLDKPQGGVLRLDGILGTIQITEEFSERVCDLIRFAFTILPGTNEKKMLKETKTKGRRQH